ncbi:hypothetical protein BCT47_16405 [Vibrio splendidus]|uniref:Uncharacterized protein n=1 Tax=Vibrio splendidus TaxID=29497 RepID=A0AB35N1H9_VIBSP|nr:hypothetical protein [Vibrio splendidus]MDP2502622.1 hypothetical protein [Vibrio splendidus]PMM76407.1 hypothetical protein BCT47_16405 [Vibrio splendidus]
MNFIVLIYTVVVALMCLFYHFKYQKITDPKHVMLMVAALFAVETVVKVLYQSVVNYDEISKLFSLQTLIIIVCAVFYFFWVAVEPLIKRSNKSKQQEQLTTK